MTLNKLLFKKILCLSFSTCRNGDNNKTSHFQRFCVRSKWCHIGKSLILAPGMYAMYDWTLGTCYIAQRTLPNILWSSVWENNLKKNGWIGLWWSLYNYKKKKKKKNGCASRYNWITLLYSRNYQNIVNQLYCNKTLKNENMLHMWLIDWLI